MAIEDFTVRLKANVKGLTKGTKEAEKSIDALVDAMVDFGQVQGQIQKTSRKTGAATAKSGSSFSKLAANTIALNQATQLLNTTFIASQKIVGGLIRPYADYEKALVGVGKTTNIAGTNLEALGANLQGLSQRIPASTNELLAIGQAAGQLGVKGAGNIANFAETIAKLGSASDLSGEVAATALTRILNVTGTSIDQVDEFASVIVGLGNNFAATESEIARMATEVSKATAIFGVSAEDSAALGAAMKSVGIQAELGGSSVGKAFRTINSAIQTGGAELEALVELTGMTGDQLEQTFQQDATKVFQSFIEGLNNIPANQVTAELEKFGLKGDEIAKTLPVLAQRADLVGKAIGDARKEMKDATALNDEAAKAFKTLDAQITITSNVFTNLASDIGKILAPAFGEFLKTLRSLAPVIKATFAALTLVDISGIVATIKETAGVISLVLLPAVLAINPGLITMAASMGVIALKFIAISSAIGGVIIGIDLLVRNFALAGDIFNLTVANIELAWVKLDAFLNRWAVKFLKLIIDTVGRVASLFGGEAMIEGAEAAVAAIEANGKAFEENAKSKAQALEATIQQSKDKISEDFDLGIIGKLIDEGTKALDGFNNSLEKSAATSKQVADNLGGTQFGPENKPPEPEAGAGIAAVKTTLFDDDTIGKFKNEFGGAFAEGAMNMSGAIGASFTGPIGAAQAIVDGAQGLVNAIPNLLNSFTGLLDSITNFPAVLVDAIGGVLDAIINLITNFIPNILKSIPKLVDKIVEFLAVGLPDAILSLADNIPALIDKVVSSLPRLIDGIIKAIPKIIKAIIKLIPILVKALIKLTASIPKMIIDAFRGGAMNLVKGMAQGANNAFKSLGEKLTGATQQLFSVIEGTTAAKGRDDAKNNTKVITKATKKSVDDLTKAWHKLMANLKSVWKDLVEIFQFVWDLIVDVWRKLWNQLVIIFQNVWDGIVTIWRNLWALVEPLWEGLMIVLQNVWDGLVSIWRNVWKLIASIWDGMVSLLTKAWDGIIQILEGLWTALGNIWDGIITSLQNVWKLVENIFGPIIDGFAKAFAKIPEMFLDIILAFADMFQQLPQMFQDIIDGFLNMFSQAVEGLTNFILSLGQLLNGLGDLLKKAFEGALDLGQQFLDLGVKIWEGLFSGLSNIGSFFADIGKDIWDGILKVFDFTTLFDFSAIGETLKSTLDAINPLNLLNKMFDLGLNPQGKGTVEELLGIDIPYVKFAQGGMVPGVAAVSGDSAQNDKVLSFLSPGELVIPRSLTQNDLFMKSLAQLIAGDVPQFQLGGGIKIGGTLGQIGEAGKSGLKQLGENITSIADGLAAQAGNIKGMTVEALKKMIADTLNRSGLPGGTPGGAGTQGGSGGGSGKGNQQFGGPFSQFQDGGIVPRGADTIPALLSPGEFILSEGAASSLGLETLRNLNATGSMPGGGTITNILDMDAGAIQITVQADNLDESFVRNEMMDIIKEELREATNGGESIISERGVF